MTSASKGTNACSVIDSAGSIDCVFDSSTAGGFVANHFWTLKVGSTETTFTTGGNTTYTPPTVCANLQGGGSLDGNGAIQMTVTLVVDDRGGNKSSGQSTNVFLYPLHQCGY